MKTNFQPNHKCLGELGPGEMNSLSIRDEPMLYGGSWDWTINNGGPITLAVMMRIDGDVSKWIGRMARKGYHPVVDTKSVLLMPGQYPCIPGWHCDGVIRDERGLQPNLNTLHNPIKHYIYSISESGNGGTEFLDNDIYHTDIDEDNVWGSVDKQIEESGDAKIKKCLNNHVYSFFRNQLHRGVEAKERTWRYFFRLSFYHMPAMNEVRNQVQVYTHINTGW